MFKLNLYSKSDKSRELSAEENSALAECIELCSLHGKKIDNV